MLLVLSIKQNARKFTGEWNIDLKHYQTKLLNKRTQCEYIPKPSTNNKY